VTKPVYSDDAAIVFWLHQAHHALRTDILRMFQEKGHDVTAEQYAILTALWQRGGLLASGARARVGTRPAGRHAARRRARAEEARDTLRTSRTTVGATACA
jgi:hypothetical protein